MIRSSVTISLVPEAKGGPFVFWGDLRGHCARAAELGFDAVEVFAPSPAVIAGNELKQLLAQHKLRLAAIGTGAGWVLRKLRLTDSDPGIRSAACQFIREMIDAAGALGAPAIVGSMQGRFDGAVSSEQALEWLAESLEDLGAHAARHNVPVLYEPLNRYETNLINTVADGVALLKRSKSRNVKLLADLYHMNIEEQSIPEAIRLGGKMIGHIHFVDSNRRAAGLGHIDLAAVAAALLDTGYNGFLSAEAVPYPDSDTAASQTIAAFRRFVK